MKLIIPFFCLLLLGCSPADRQAVTNGQEDERKLARAPSDWINRRVLDSEARLKNSAAGQKLLDCINAHGGLTNWFGNGPISFRFDYQPLDGGSRRNSYQTIDQWSVRSVHEVWHQRDWKFGWDGKKAWKSTSDSLKLGMNPRFWSNTPFYFVGLPFVLADPGVILTDISDISYNGIAYDLIRATYESGTGDAPDDFYVVYINRQTGLMGGLRYVVSYPGFFPDGGHSPEKFMQILALEEIANLKLPTGYHTHWWKNGQVAEHITRIDVSDIKFLPNLDSDFFDIPDGAFIQEGW